MRITERKLRSFIKSLIKEEWYNESGYDFRVSECLYKYWEENGTGSSIDLDSLKAYVDECLGKKN